jgi:hypothetical protein
VPCFEYLYVRTPPAYTNQTICLKISKTDQQSGPVFKVFVSNFNGWAALDITLLPSKFFSPFPKYRLEFLENNGIDLIEFNGKDGKIYQGIDFFFDNNPAPNNIENLNAIDSAYYD